MATTEQLGYLPVRDWFYQLSPDAIAADPPLAIVGAVKGLRFRKLLIATGNDDIYVCPFRLTTEGTSIPTGLTLSFAIQDDPNAADAGKVARMGMAIKKLVSGTDDTTLTGISAYTYTDVTLDATTGQTVVATIAITTMDSAGEGDHILIAIKRDSLHANDTHTGGVVIHSIALIDT